MHETDDYMALSFIANDNAVDEKRVMAKAKCGDKQQRKKQRRFSQQEHMDNTLKEGLSKPIASTNKGFKLLEKFGYKKEDGGLGKLGTGILEPIDVRPQLCKPSHFGIGKEKSLSEIQTRFKEELARHRASMACLETDFRESLKHRQECRMLMSDIMQAEKIIEQLDQKDDITRHDLWPRAEVEVVCGMEGDSGHDSDVNVPDEKEEEKVCEADEDVDYDDDFPRMLHKLEFRLAYLRSTHLYCLYCGCAFESFEDMGDSCSGPLRDDH